MTKHELMKVLVREHSYNRIEADFTVRVMLEILSDLLARGNRIEIRGFGTFGVLLRSARVGRNPRSGKPLDIPAKKYIRFRAGKKIRESIADQFGS